MQNGVEQQLSDRLSAALPELIHSEPAGTKPLCRHLQKSMRLIRRYYRRLCKISQPAGADRLLAEQFSTVEGIGGELQKLFRPLHFRAVREALPDVFLCLKTILDIDGFHFTDQTIRQFILRFEQSRPLTNTEHDLLPALIRAAALSLLGETLANGDTAFRPDLVERCLQTLFEAGQLDGEQLNNLGNQLERILAQDPSGVYPSQNDRTRALYRYRTARAAELSGTDEITLGKKLLAQSQRTGRHIGYGVSDCYEKERRKNPLAAYHFRLLFFLPGVLSLLLSGGFGNPLWALLLYWPLLELCRPVLERLLLKGTEVTYAPRLAWKEGVPEEARTLVAISTLLPGGGQEELSALEDKLADMAVTNGRGAVGFCLLCDLKASPEPSSPDDHARIAALKKRILELNRRFDDRFVLLVRERRYSPTQQEYTGWERKRGAITELIGLRFGKPVAVAELCGNTSLIYRSRYLLTLDYDTGLTIGAAEELASIASHPMNRPVIDRGKGIVTAGYGILAPRMTLSLKGSLQSRFSRILGGIGGLSSYDAACGELYQDLYGQSIFSGKGFIDMEAYHELIPGLFEEETVLSHDILEGSFLRTLFVGDVELTDGFPGTGEGFFKRLHRWIRGDFQNTPFLFTDNPLPSLARFQLFDNLRRALLPVFSMACLWATAFLGDWRQGVLAAVGVLSAVAPPLYSLWRMLATGTLAPLATRFYSGVLPKSLELLGRAGILLLLLPQFAWTALDAAVKGLYRRYVSHRRLLEWNPAASAGRDHLGGGRSILRQAAFYWPQWIGGAVCLLGGSTLLCVVFWLAVPLVILISKDSKARQLGFSVPAKEQLLEDVERMLQYYEDFAGEADHFLPPDNVQQAPTQAIAHRTSPTNIGLLLLSWLTACDLQLLSPEGLRERADRLLSTLEGLEKFHGNLYNWYDTRTLCVLPPGFVSAVDSGNLLCCLTAFKEGVRELEGKLSSLQATRRRVEALLAQADLTVFYDKKRKLFSIGWDSASQTLSPSHYDMLMSEARMMSYFAVATGQAPLGHWAALSRTLSRRGGHTGPMSWTGTMFEYYMPELLLHSIRGSIGYEALGYCLACQKRRTRFLRLRGAGKNRFVPWGISESGIFRFDNQLNYQYSPNGVQKLALKQGMDKEVVVSPYSSYLVISRDPEGACQNLIRLKGLGAYGKYGFYEAVDFTPARVGENPYEIVKSQMAHHLGMSIIAVGNALTDNRMQKRFLRDPQMRAAQELLSEKLPVGEILLSETLKRKTKPFPPREPDDPVPLGSLFPQQPRVKLLSNADMTCVATDSGASYLRCGRTDMTRRPTDLLRGAVGSFCFVHTGGETTSLTFAPGYQSGVVYETAFSPGGVVYEAKADAFSAKTEVRMPRSLPCEQRRVTLQNRSGEEREFTLLFYQEPSLYPREDDEAHKSFSKLFLELSWEPEERVVVVSRRKRGKEALFWLAAGFREEVDFDLISSREEVFARPSIQCPRREVFTEEGKPPEKRPFFSPDPCIAFRVRLTLQRDESRTLTLLTAAGRSRHEALSCLGGVRRDPIVDSATAVRSRFREGSLPQRIAQTVLPQILFHRRDSAGIQAAAAENRLGPDSLWEFGVSGDFPLLLCEVLGPGDLERVTAYTVCHSLLKLSFVDCDLLFLYEGGEETAAVLRETVEKHCQPGALGARAGIHLLSGTGLTMETKRLLQAAACHIASRGLVRLETPQKPYKPLAFRPLSPLPLPVQQDVSVEGGAFSGKSFFCGDSRGIQPPNIRPWCHILSNPTFGTLASDRALGFTWAINSRQGKITPWFNDPLRDNNGEMLLLREGEDCFDLINGSRAEFNPDYLRYEGFAGDRTGELPALSSCVTVRVPARGMIKYVEVSLTNPGSSPRTVEVSYYTEPCLGVNRDSARQISGSLLEGVLLLRNPWNRSLPSYLGLWTEGEFSSSCDRPAFLCGDWSQHTLPPQPDPCAALTVRRTIPSGGQLHLVFCMAFAATEEAVIALLRLRPRERVRMENQLLVNSGDPSVDALVNTWLPWQTLASRLWGRTGFYQNGGAYGFRDQLQDVISLLPLIQRLAKIQLLRCCAVQFEAGDVMHWWHPLPKGYGGRRGVRTRYSDDLVWLAWAVGEYVERTGDEGLLRIPVAYLQAEELTEGQKDAYIEARPTAYRETVWEHCKRALRRALHTGRHGLPKMGGGDWNDGYNRVGIGGKGESVWLAQFLSIALRKAASLAVRMGEMDTAREYREYAQALLQAVDRHAWDGQYYLRAFYDDGSPMGSHQNEECSLDSLTQSFAVLSGMPDKTRLDAALGAACRELVDRKKGILRLFAPSFTGNGESRQKPGYVQAYPEGIRENGGQYTHASVWLAMSARENGWEEEFFRLTELLNPILRCQEPGSAKEYGLEPFWLAADIYTNPDAYGRGGWSMYTGSAGWYYRLLTETMLGFFLREGRVERKPCLPPGMENARLIYEPNE